MIRDGFEQDAERALKGPVEHLRGCDALGVRQGGFMSKVFSSVMCLLVAAGVSASLTGCSLKSSDARTADAGLAIRGRVLGGNQPIAGAQVYLFAANAGVFTPNASGYGNASLSLLTAGTLDTNPDATHGDYYVSTDGTGAFSITGDYSCTPNQQVYLYATGGNPGLTAGTNNTSAGLLAVLGNCPGAGNFLTATPFIAVNEVSTVAAAYAFAGFATDALHVSSSGTPQALAGIANAFANAANLETLSTGVALAATPSASASSTVPQAEINTLADILAACVSTTGAVTGGFSPTPCYTLFTNALSGGTTGAQPGETATAAINIAHNPGANVAALYGLTATNPPFTGLPVQPNDFTIVLTFSGGGIYDPAGIAVDGPGNVWTANPDGNSVSELSSLGAPVSGAGGYTGGGSMSSPYGIAVDANTPANVWVTNNVGSSVTELNSSGTASAGSPYTAGSMDQPVGIAIDAAGNLWIANYGNSTVTELTSAGAAYSGTPSTGGGLSAPFGIAIDTSGNAWVANSSGSSVSEFTSAGAVHSGAPYGGGGVSNSEGVAFDSSGNAWISNIGSTTSSVTELNSSGAPSGGSPYSGGGLSAGGSGLIAVDGAGNVWIANLEGGAAAPNPGGGSVSELSNTGAAISGANGYTGADASGGDPMENPIGVAIDPSGNVWVSCLANVVELVGAATPVVTPLSTAVATAKLGTRP
jgi:hypothetical protein